MPKLEMAEPKNTGVCLPAKNASKSHDLADENKKIRKF
jgi:hypothetical protein